MDPLFKVQIQVRRNAQDKAETIEVSSGSNLRKNLLQSGFNPYRGAKKVFNCHGMGICGTCKVLVLESGTWWERRSCQIQCFNKIEIQLK